MSVIFASCTKSSGSGNSNGTLGVDFTPSTYFFHATTLPLGVYVNGELKATLDLNGTTTLPCSEQQAYVLIDLPSGSYTVDFVAPYGNYLEGTATITAGLCEYANVVQDDFSNARSNYGTKNGTLEIYRTSIPFTNSMVYVDNVYAGNITTFPYAIFCGDNNEAEVSVQLSPGSHTYKVVDPDNNLVWNGSVNILSNQCNEIQL